MEPSTGTTKRTVEAAFDHLELFEVRESAPFRRDSTSELVVVVAVPRYGVSPKLSTSSDWELLGQPS